MEDRRFGTKTRYFIRAKYFTTYIKLFLSKKNFDPMVNRYNKITVEKMDKKSASKASPTSLDLSWGCVFVVKGWLGGGVKWKGRSLG
jgi:hypothetical protein